MSRRAIALLGVSAAVVLAGAAGALTMLPGGPGATSTSPGAGAASIVWTGPVRTDPERRPVEALGNAADGTLAWSDPADAAPSWANIGRIGVNRDFGSWQLELGSNPPQRDALAAAGQVLGFGFVMDTTGDGMADYVVGIDTDAVAPAVHVWLTDLTTGETRERSSGPYGDPFDFATILEGDDGPGALRPPGGTFFNVGFAPPELFDVETTRFYAWSSLTEAGEVVAWDYAPDRGWLGAEPQERVGCTLLACPMTRPEPGPGSREWIVTVQNTSSRDAHLFVANDTMPMGELVGTAEPASVPAGASQRVRLTVPSGSGWAIFVNPSATMGPLITEQDVPAKATGVLPITIMVQANGMPVVSAPGEPGWFGN